MQHAHIPLPESRTESQDVRPLSDSRDCRAAPCEAPGAFSEALVRYLAARDYLNALKLGAGIEEEERASVAYMEAEHKLMETPAPDISAVRTKFDVLLLDPNASPTRDYMLLLFADFQHLTGGRVSYLFEPDRWLQWFEAHGGAYCVRGEEVFLLQPKGTDLSEQFFELEASGGREAVDELIKSRMATEAVDGLD